LSHLPFWDTPLISSQSLIYEETILTLSKASFFIDPHGKKTGLRKRMPVFFFLQNDKTRLFYTEGLISDINISKDV